MSKFQVGDKVRIIDESWAWGDFGYGDIVEIKEVKQGGVSYRINDYWSIHDDQIELVESKPATKYRVGDTVSLMSGDIHRTIEAVNSDGSYSFGGLMKWYDHEFRGLVGPRLTNVDTYHPEDSKKSLTQLIKENKPMANLIHKLRLNKLNKTDRSLQKHNVVDDYGVLTTEGRDVFLNNLWEKNKDVQKEIADQLDAIAKEEKSDK